MSGSLGSGNGPASAGAATPWPFLSCAPSTVPKDGQNPLRQEKSLLQLDWSMVRLRPNSVSSGCTDTQFDCTPQSPQPSQTSSLMMTRRAGAGHWPRGAGRVFVRLVGDDDDALRAFRRDLAGDLRHREAAVVLLAAGHGDGIVEEGFSGGVEALRDRGA